MSLRILMIISGEYRGPRFKEEGHRRGHVVDCARQEDLLVSFGREKVEITVKGIPVEEYDVIYLCNIARTKFEWFSALNSFVKSKKIVVVNQCDFFNSDSYIHSELWAYVKQYENKMRFPETFIISVSGIDSISQKIKTFPVIVKSLFSCQGKGVFIANSTNEIKEILNNNSVMFPELGIVREFIPNDGDIRVFTIGYKAIGAMKRTSPLGDFRSNISQGGIGTIFDLENNSEVCKMAEELSRELFREIAGVDIMIHKNTGVPYILEMNSGPGFRGFEEYTGINVAGKIIEYLESIYLKNIKNKPRID